MVLITDFEKTPSDGGTSRSRTQSSCGYRQVQLASGTRVVQLETYGSAERKLTGKASQSIELDREAAAALVKILREAFPGL